MMSRSQKESMLAGMQQSLATADAAFLVHYGGLDVAKITELRCQLHAVGGGLSVVKNRLFLKALQAPGYESYEALHSFFKGPVGVVYLKGDVGVGAQVLHTYSEAEEKFQIKAGFYDGSLLQSEDIKALASLPSREVLLGKLLSSIVGVHRSLLFVLSGPSQQLVRVLQGVKENKNDPS